MFGKKKEKKEKIKEEKRKEKSVKEQKKKTKSTEIPAESDPNDLNGFMWGGPPGAQPYPQGSVNGYARDQMGEAIYIQKSNSVINGHESGPAPKYGAKNLKLVQEKDGKKEKKDKKDKNKSGILKKKEKAGAGGQGMMIFDTQQPTAHSTPTPGQVTFAGPDNKVHQSVVKISQASSSKPPDILPNNYQTNMPNGQHPNGFLSPMYQPPVNGASPMMHAPNAMMTSPYAPPAAPSPFGNAPRMPQQFSGSRLAVPGLMANGIFPPQPPDGRGAFPVSTPNIAYNGHTPVRATNSDPNTPMTAAAESVKHLQISQGVAGTRHVTSIDVIGKANQNVNPSPYAYARDRSPSPFGYCRDRSPSPFGHARHRSHSPAGFEHTPIASAQGGIPPPSVQNVPPPTITHGYSAITAQNQQNNYPQKSGLPAQHNKGPAPAPPIVLAEVNITENMVPPQQREAYAKFDRMVERAREDEITYAQLLFDKQNTFKKKKTDELNKEKIANYTIEMDSDEENAHPLRIKGILKAPKKVEFNKDVDVTLFGTLSRHESLESLYTDRIRGRDIMASRRKCAPAQYVPQPPPYASVIEERPLDDTDLYMYTMRRRRHAPTVYVTRGYDETLRGISRHSSLRASGSRGRPSVRTVRVLPSKHAMW